MTSPKPFTFTDVVQRISQFEGDELSSWLNLIEDIYLTSANKTALAALRTKFASSSSIPQRTLGVQFSVSQYLLSRRIHAVREKIFTLYSYLHSPDLVPQYLAAKHAVTPRQYELLNLVLAGNRLYQISGIWGVKKECVTVTFQRLLFTLSKHPNFKLIHRFALYTGKQMWFKSEAAKANQEA